MDMNAILQNLAKMFPSVNLGQAVNKAQEALNGVPDTLEGVTKAAANLGIDKNFIQKFYTKYGNTNQARIVCGMLGTTPEALKADAERIVGSENSAQTQPRNTNGANTSGTVSKKFPRLK